MTCYRKFGLANWKIVMCLVLVLAGCSSIVPARHADTSGSTTAGPIKKEWELIRPRESFQYASARIYKDTITVVGQSGNIYVIKPTGQVQCEIPFGSGISYVPGMEGNIVAAMSPGYVAISPENRQEPEVYVYNTINCRPISKVKLKGALLSNSVVIYGGTLVVVEDFEMVTAYDIESTLPLWTAMREEIRGARTGKYKLQVVNDMLLVWNYEVIRRLDVQTGTTLWEIKLGQQESAWGKLSADPPPMLYADNCFYLGATLSEGNDRPTKTTMVLDSATGKIVTRLGHNHVTAVVKLDEAPHLLAFNYGDSSSSMHQAILMDAQTLKVAWNSQSVFEDAVQMDSYLVSFRPDGHFIFVDTHTGNVHTEQSAADLPKLRAQDALDYFGSYKLLSDNGILLLLRGEQVRAYGLRK